MAISYDASFNTITVTGYTEAAPCTFDDIYNADVAGGWGVVSKQCDNQYCFDCKLTFGDGTTETWFADEGKQFTMAENALTGSNQNLIYIINNAHFRLGRLVNKELKETDRGCDFLIYSTGGVHYDMYPVECADGANLELYGCHFINIVVEDDNVRIIGYNAITKIYNCIFDRVGLDHFLNIDTYNIDINNAYAGLKKLSGTIDKIKVTNSVQTSIWFSRYTSIFKNIYAHDSQYLDIVYEGSRYSVENMRLINPDLDNYNIYWVLDQYMSFIYRQYEFDLHVTNNVGAPIQNANVTITNLSGTVVYSGLTDANGDIPTQVLNYGYYSQPNGNTPTMQTPHTIEIKKDGTNYLTYKTDFTVDEKIDWRIMMVDVSDIVDGINDIKGTGFVKDTHSLPQCITATGFNTVVPDPAGTAPTATEIRTEMEGAGHKLAAIEEDTGTTLDDHLTDIKGTGFVKDTHSLPQCITADVSELLTDAKATTNKAEIVDDVKKHDNKITGLLM